MLNQSTEHYISDEQFYTYIKFNSLAFEKDTFYDEHEVAEEYFKLSDLMLNYLSGELGYIFNRIELDRFDQINLYLDKDNSYLKFDEELEKAQVLIDKSPNKNKLKNILLKAKKNPHLTFKEVGALSWEWYEIYQFIQFDPKQFQKDKYKKAITDLIDEYLENFINDRLKVTTQNYIKFNHQKAIFIKLIEDEKMIEMYGNNFILTDMGKKVNFSFLQTAYALEKLEYLKINRAWSGYHPDSKNAISINISLNQDLIDEINEQYQKENPDIFFESYDDNNKVIKIAGQEVFLAKKGKDTDAIKLLETLLSEEKRIWYNDEIVDNWGYHIDDNIPKNKIYQASRKLNQLILKVTQIEDFITGTTSEFAINPKYIKIDE